MGLESPPKLTQNRKDLALVGNDSGRKYIVLRNLQKIIESTVFGVVLA